MVILLDADYSFPIAKSIAEHLGDRGGLPEMILVGVAYAGPPEYRLNRTRDYTPTKSRIGYGPEIQEKSGGAEKFRSFLISELIPFMANSYRVETSDVTLVGHSYGGLFAMYCLITEPRVVSKLVIVSPSLWYDNRWMFKQASAYRGTTATKLSVYGAAGSSELGITKDLRAFEPLLKKLVGSQSQSLVEVLNGENHDSVFPSALSRGLRFVFGRMTTAEPAKSNEEDTNQRAGR